MLGMSIVTRISRAAMMGLAWAFAWVPIGVVGARVFVGELDPPHIGGPLYAGFICGSIFSALAGLASGRRLSEMSSAHAAGWGAASGALAGVIPFVIGDNGSYNNGWATMIVATSSIAAAIVANRLRIGELSPSRAAALVAMVGGLLTGALQWFLTTENTIERWGPVALIGALALLGGLTAFVSPLIARWQRPPSPEPRRSTTDIREGYGG